MTKPALSIGMPVYNGSAYIDEALTSLRAQSRGDFELIVSDNASTDETPDIIAKHAALDPRIIAIRQPKNLGAISNFLAVLEKAKAPHFMWAASDDVWSPEWVEHLLPASQKRNCIAFGRVQMMEADGRLRRHAANGRNFSFGGPRTIRRLRYFMQPGFLGKANPFYSIFPREFLTDETLAPFKTGARGSDVLTLYKLLDQTELVSVDNAQIFKRHHDASAARGESKNIPFRRTQLPEFLALSSPTERAALIMLFPLAAAMIPIRRIAWQVARKLL